MSITTSAGTCPRCQTPLVTEHERVPWCPACEWNLDTYERDRRQPELGWDWIDRATYRVAYRLTRRQFTALSGRPVGRTGASLPRIVLLSIAVVLLAALVGCAYFGIVLVAYHFPSPTIVPGALLVLVAVELRPRFGRRDRYLQPLAREQAPTLFRLVDEVATAVGAPLPHELAVDDRFNASAGTYGLRRRRVMRIGLPLLAVLTPQERVALVGHELGHYVNGDLRRGFVTQIPLTVLRGLTDLLHPGPRRRNSSALIMLADLVVRPIQWSLRFVAWCGLLAVVWVEARDGQRAEYLADELGARAAGSEAATSLLDVLVSADVITMIAAREARQRRGPAQWRAAVREVRADIAPRAERLRSLSIRDRVSMFASHPPAGLRARLIASRTHQTAAVVLTEADAERMDAELARQYGNAGRTLAGG
jgi:heat shock protein HtpX